MDGAEAPYDVAGCCRAFQRAASGQGGHWTTGQQKWNEYRPALVAPPNQLLATVDSVANASSKMEEGEIFILYHDRCVYLDCSNL